VIIHRDLIQGTEDWYNMRCGKFTASLDFQQLATGTKTIRDRLILKKASERITGKPILSDFSNKHMQRGKLLEQEAVDAFQMETWLDVDRVGFVEGTEWFGCSPDGLIGENAGLEIKCKEQHTHLYCLLKGYDTSYDWQMQGNLYTSGREFWYFVSYNPDYSSKGKGLFVHKVYRDEKKIAQIKNGIEKGIEEIESILNKI